ncbi:alpha/beta-hydrolase [Paraphaeosphaeria sporulosa]|uniref:Alpha/beta-hydrolase n=1 Tax=Paraphaeosphaeria sporulosa TaxID=1460663 RepID=A0A177CUE0_9PLEO|nr:alpha/beta-hydrolase [Paraphaeosphaeria sporulosa]OAG11154.1 alpha/beta-hydrolase [Paraphaeosphaeria sporulosa]
MAHAVLLSSLIFAAARANPIARDVANQTMVTPFSALQWTPCYDNFTCARLIVPLDYAEPDAGNTTIAYIKLPSATQPAEDILYNPGGPGNSGVDAVLHGSAQLLNTLGTTYNLIGFDPRGVNNSGPSLSCFPGDPASEALFKSQFHRPINSKSPESLARQFEIAGAWGERCSSVHRNDSARYVGTIATARDMLNYVEKRAVAEGQEVKVAKLWYWGISYGTVLGSTFATLFPDRIGRMILDGVVDVETYYKNNASGLSQSDEAVLSFAKACHTAGREKCAFYSSTTKDITKRMRNIIEDVRKDPVPVADLAISPVPTLITYEDLVFTLFVLLYSPVQGFPLLAQIFAELEQRNGSSIALTIQAVPPTGVDYGGLISCMDSVKVPGAYNISTMAIWEQHVKEENKQSQWVGDGWATVSLLCRKMNIIPPESQRFSGKLGANETSFPILFIGNTIDPITPIVGARRMSNLFPGSVLFTQDSIGHTSLAASSACTSHNVQQYLGGVLPAANITCKIESVPFITDV